MSYKVIFSFLLIFLFIYGCKEKGNQSSLREKNKQKKVLFIIVDGISSDMLKNANTPYLDSISLEGMYTDAYVGGKRGTYSETPTISAVGYNSLLTGTWVNKHNVFGNKILQPNYNYPTIFRIFKNNYPEQKIAIFSTWLDNRTKLIGENLLQTGNIKMDYSYDGFELDTIRYPHDKNRNYIKNIDKAVATEAANYIKKESPDLSWVYLEYSDDVGHGLGDSPELNAAIEYEDKLVGKIWQAIKYRERNFNEDWLMIITTDHGRTAKDGKDHGGQSDRERSTWIVMNKEGNSYSKNYTPAIVDIFPTITKFLNIQIPDKNKKELDGISMFGKVDAKDLNAFIEDGNLIISWKNLSDNKVANANIYISYTNNMKKEGKEDNYELLSEVSLSEQTKIIPLPKESNFYKINLETENTNLNTWIINKD